ncbi:MAG: divalent-cation tolerance protein CutA [Hyphomonadaceae bacterium]
MSARQTSHRFIDIWVNCPDIETAKHITDAALERRLAACANVWGRISSTYRWQGEIKSGEEYVLALKTRAELFQPICEVVHALHTYEAPAIYAFDIADVDGGYANWLLAETENPDLPGQESTSAETPDAASQDSPTGEDGKAR